MLRVYCCQLSPKSTVIILQSSARNVIDFSKAKVRTIGENIIIHTSSGSKNFVRVI